MLSKLITGLRALLRKPDVERELDEEMQFHLEKEIERNVGRGMSPEEARMAALRSFGGVDQIKEECRDARGVRWLEDIWQDLRYGIRMMVKAPGFTVVAVFVLSLGIGANTAIFSVTDKLLIRSLATKNPHDLVLINSISVSPYFVSNSFSYPEFSDYRGCPKNRDIKWSKAEKCGESVVLPVLSGSSGQRNLKWTEGRKKA